MHTAFPYPDFTVPSLPTTAAIALPARFDSLLRWLCGQETSTDPFEPCWADVGQDQSGVRFLLFADSRFEVAGLLSQLCKSFPLLAL